MVLRAARPLLITLLMLAAAGAAAQPHVQAPPAELPQITHKRLLNDFQISVASTAYLGETMTIGLQTRYGAAFDPMDKGGLANLVCQMFTRATIDRTAKEIEGDLQYLGARLDIRCDWDGIRFILEVPSSRFERALLLLYQVVGEAVFEEADFARVKAEALKRLAAPGDPRRFARERFEIELFRGTTFGRPLQGTTASVGNITLGDVRYFHRRFFSPNAASLVVVGSAPAAVVMQKAARIWGVWVRTDETPFTFLPPKMPASRPVTLVDDPGSVAAQFILGNLWVTRDDPGYYPAVLAARILQERLTQRLPTSLVTVSFEARRLSGPFWVQGQAAADAAAGEIEKILRAVEEFRSATVSPAELAATQKSLIDEYRKSLGSTASLCALMMDAELYRLGTNYMVSYPDLITRTPLDAVAAAAKQWVFPSGALIVVRGPAAALKPALEKLGTLQ
jgi:zinc protease